MLDLNRLCLGCMNELEEENKTCKICGWNSEADENSPHQLKCGTVLQGKYLVGKVLGEGGFGITYLGYNLILQEKVAIKEFYPHGFVGRETTVNSTVVSYVGQEAFTEKAKDGFIREAKTMQSLNKVEGIVEMKDVFSENQTVYIVMEYVEGQTLKDYVKQNGNKLPMSTVLKLLEPVMDALEQIHAHNLIHRDISPDNIMVGPDGRVTLLDLGAARQISADGGHSLTVNVKHGYAPMEQYQTHGEQGPWTDIYALCATIYRLITGKVPPSAADRVFDDSMVRPMLLGADVTEEQEKVLLKGLAPRSGDRYLNMFELREAFKLIEKEKVVEEVIVQEDNISTENEKEVKKYINVKDEIKTKSKCDSEKFIKIAIAVATTFLIVGISFFSAEVIEKNRLGKEYNSAVLLAENGKYEEAIAAFELLDDYKDSAEQIVNCENSILENKYQEAIVLMEEEKYKEAIAAFEKLEEYKVSKEKYNFLFKNLNKNLVNKSIDASLHHTVGLESDGTVVGTGRIERELLEIYNWEDIIMITTGPEHIVGLKSDGTVIASGCNDIGLSNWKNLVAVSAGYDHTVGLKDDGTVVAVGKNDYGQCNVSDWKGIVAVSAGKNHTVGLKYDGTVVATGWGYGYYENENFSISDWTDIIAISAKCNHTIGLKSDGTVVAAGANTHGQCNIYEWENIVSIATGSDHTVGLKSDGTVVAIGNNDYGQCNTYKWENIVSIATGSSHTIGLKSDGTVVAVGENFWGECDVSNWKDIKIPKGNDYIYNTQSSTPPSIEVGDYITFGSYEQDNNLENGAEPIEWQVLDVQEGKALVISKYALDSQRYNNTSDSVSWETCSLRKWLNSTFINTAFNEEEQQKIIYTVISNQNAESEASSENNTEEKIFLLSIEEAKQYFHSNEERKCKPSDYIKKYFDPSGNCYWWLRSQGNNKELAHHINYDGDFTISSVNIDIIDVRPVMWIGIANSVDDKNDKDVTTINVSINENINLKLDTVLGAKSFSKSGNIPGGTKLAGEWVLNDNNEYVFTMNIEGKAETAGEYLFSVDYLDETGKVVETKEYLINVEESAEQEEHSEETENEESSSSAETVSDKLSLIQGTWINRYQSNEVYGYKLVIEGNNFVFYNKRGKIVQDIDGNDIKGTVEYWDITESWYENNESIKFKNYTYIFNWGFGKGHIYLRFDPETKEIETILRIHDAKIDGEYYKET